MSWFVYDENDIHWWDDTSLITPSTTDGYGFKVITKDIDFGDPGQRKKIYKVYITYESNGASNVNVYWGKDGEASHTAGLIEVAAGEGWTAFDDSSRNYAASGGLASAGTTSQRAELVFSTPSDLNNVYSFQLKLEGTASTQVPITFKINDIQIIYRKKSVK